MSTATKVPRMKKFWKRMDQSLSIIKSFNSTFAVEIFKTKYGMSAAIVSDISLLCTGNYNNLRQPQTTFFHLLHEYYGSESLSYLCLKMWKSIPTELKQKPSLKTFKESIKL